MTTTKTTQYRVRNGCLYMGVVHVTPKRSNSCELFAYEGRRVLNSERGYSTSDGAHLAGWRDTREGAIQAWRDSSLAQIAELQELIAHIALGLADGVDATPADEAKAAYDLLG